MSWNKMSLEILTPEKEVISVTTDKIVAEAKNGSFCLKPRHVDFLTELVPGILSYWIDQEEYLMALSSGILVKRDEQVMISVRHAIAGEHLEDLEEIVREKFRIVDQKEQQTQIALEQLQADFIKRFIEMQKQQ